MDQYNFSKICKSCSVPTKNKITYCWKCNHDPNLKQCELVSKAFNQCKLKTICDKCIYHNVIEMSPAQLLIE
jgi:hypothetical protein